MKNSEVLEFAKEQGYNSISKLCDWGEYEVYEPLVFEDAVADVGLPLVILVKGKDVRMSTVNEAFEIMDEEERHLGNRQSKRDY